jgi:hypothetical protein
MSSLYGISAYQQTNQTWSTSTKKSTEVSNKQTDTSRAETSKSETEIKKSTWQV